ncbi:MFS transporter [Hydrogenophaga sp. BPS33]|uniref:MFS transporter n=1 Tax=Hydrogenophaga sp. BPS33 TaxID=2651974 RepID=UPI00131F7067|nr:MFS transporter [Hydrogenophaga sp. BPS33]QHE87698.1 MFS transporter [Hydrogenophaga sp. BPS33]
MTDTPSAHPQPFRLMPLAFAALAGTMAMMAYVAVIGPVVRRLGLPEWVAGLSVTAGGVFWMLLARWWGGVSDRHGRKPVLLIGLGAFALTYGALALGVDLALRGLVAPLGVIALLIVTRSLVGAFYAAVPPTAAATIADHTLPQWRAASMAKLGTANALGMVVGPAAAGWLATHDLGLALYAAAMLPLLALLVVSLGVHHRVPPRVPHAAAPAGGKKPGPALGLFDPRLRQACTTAFLAMVSVAIAQVLVGFLAIDRLGLSEQAGARVAGLSLTAVGVSLVVSQQFVMRLKGVPPTRWIWLGALIAGLGFGGVLFAFSQSAILLCYGIAAFGMGLIFPTFQAMAANAVESHEQGAAAGVLSAAQGLGMVLGPLGGTLLYHVAPALPYLVVGAALLALSLFTAVRGGVRPASRAH